MVALVMVVLASCSPAPEPEVAPAPAEVTPPPVLTEVRLPFLEVTSPFRWDDEFRGLATMAVELGLSDLPGVLVRPPGHAASPSVLLALPVSRRQVDARFVVTPLPGGRTGETPLAIELELCVAGGGCGSTTAVGTREAPWEAFGQLLDGAAATLGAEVPPEVAVAWRAPGSADPYAELMTGRAAATLYGLRAAPTEPEDRRSNPVLRAVFLDPKQPLALWTLARWEVGARADGGKAADLLARAALARPTSPVFDADLATVLLAAGKADAAVLAWEHVRARAADDPRFLEPAARALLAAGRGRDARAVLDVFPAEFTWEPRVAALRVAVAEAVDGSAGLDPLLAHWQDTDPRAAEPVRRRVELRVRSGQFEAALQLLPALHAREPGPRTDALEVALLVALGRIRAAAEVAPAGVRERLEARAARERDPGATVTGLIEPREAALAEADALVWRGDAGAALAVVDGVLRARPWNAEAHALRARALEALGRGDEAAAAWARAFELDPAMEGGPVTVTRVADAFRYEVPAAGPASGIPGEGDAAGRAAPGEGAPAAVTPGRRDASL